MITEQSTFNININNFIYRSRMAAFDYDDTLVTRKSNAIMAKDVDDWRWLSPDVPEIVKAFYKRGYAIVVFSNHLKSSISIKIEQMIKVLSLLEIPINVYIETNKEFKKPNPRMYELYTENKTLVNKKDSFYVGDALGRPGDFADSDKKFAENIGIKCFSPEDIFEIIDI